MNAETKTIDSLISVRVALAHPEEDRPGAEFNFLFVDQPTAKDVLAAFDNDPRCTRNKEAMKYRSLLQQGLATFGVPKLYEFNIMDENGYNIVVPSVQAEWIISMLGRDQASPGRRIGNIGVSRNPIFHNAKSEPAPKVGKSGKPEPAPATKKKKSRPSTPPTSSV